jgi:hypothetical protein
MNKRVLGSSVFEQFGLFRFGVRSRRGASLPLVWFCLFGVICPHRGAAQETDSRDNRPVFNVRNFGARGDGKADDRRAFAAVFRRAAKEPKAEIFVPTGFYVLRSPQDSSGPGRADPASLRTYLEIPDTDLRIRGAGIDRTRIQTAIEGTLLDGVAARGSILELSDLSVAYTAGFSTLTNSFAVRFAGQVLRATNVEFKNYTQAIRVPEGVEVREMLLNRCRFYYDHGRAGVSQADETFQYPITSILGAADNTTIQGCEFDGLTDPTFSSVGANRNTHAEIPPSQLTPIDGLIKTIHMGRSVRIFNNVVRNGGIEHILIDGGGLETDRVEISGNKISGPNPTEMNSGSIVPRKTPTQTHSGFYFAGMSGITITRANAYIHDNQINDTRIGIGVDLGLAPANSGVRIVNNHVLNCIIGIQLSNSRDALVQGNFISINRPFANAERETGEAAAQAGIRLIDSPYAKIEANQIQLQNEGWWAGVMRTKADSNTGDNTLKVESIPPELMKAKRLFIMLSTAEKPVICSPATVESDEQLEVAWPLPAAIPKGASVLWSIGSVAEQAAICSYRSSGSVSQNNQIQGGIQPFVHFDERHTGPIFSRHDTLQGYVPQTNGAVQFQ